MLRFAVATMAMMILSADCAHNEVRPERPTVGSTPHSQAGNVRATLEEIDRLASEYYRRPQPERIPEMMQALTVLHRAAKNPSSMTDAAAKGYSSLGTKSEEMITSGAVGGVAAMTGFLAEAFRDNPDKRERWIKTDIEGEEAQQSILHALALAGLQRLAMTAMEEYGWSSERINRAVGPGGSINRIPPIWNYQPGVPADMDMFWGAFAASGKEQYVFKVLEIYKSVAAQTDIKVSDIEFLAQSTVKGTASRESYNRFQEYPEQQRMWIVSAGTALWGMGAQAAQHERIKEILVGYFEQSKKTEADWALVRQIARSSKRVSKTDGKTVGIMAVLTTDPDFINTELPKMKSGGLPALPEKIFRRTDRVFVVTVVLTHPHTTGMVTSELYDPQQHLVAQGREPFPPPSVPKGDYAISAYSVQTMFKPDSSLGFYINRYSVQTDKGESFSGETEFLLQE
jgi:hypothetical protein